MTNELKSILKGIAGSIATAFLVYGVVMAIYMA